MKRKPQIGKDRAAPSHPEKGLNNQSKARNTSILTIDADINEIEFSRLSQKKVTRCANDPDESFRKNTSGKVIGGNRAIGLADAMVSTGRIAITGTGRSADGQIVLIKIEKELGAPQITALRLDMIAASRTEGWAYRRSPPTARTHLLRRAAR